MFRCPLEAVCGKGCSDVPGKLFVVRDVQMSPEAVCDTGCSDVPKEAVCGKGCSDVPSLTVLQCYQQTGTSEHLLPRTPRDI